ncbi:FixH family protein, partial [Bdellovibrionota bacterium FG-2]
SSRCRKGPQKLNERKLMKHIISTLAIFGTLALVSETLSFADATANGTYDISGNWSELKRGWNTLTLKVVNTDQQGVTGATVSVAYDMKGMTMSPPDRPVEEKDGAYEKKVFIGMNGTWKFDATVSAGGVDDTLSKEVLITK